MKKYYAETLDGKYIICTSSDDDAVAVWFHVNSLEEAEETDCSNIEGMTADQMLFEYPEHSFRLDLNSDEWEEWEEITQYYFPDDAYADLVFGNSAPCLLTLDDIIRLAREWEMDLDTLLEQMHEATCAEIEEYM